MKVEEFSALNFQEIEHLPPVERLQQALQRVKNAGYIPQVVDCESALRIINRYREREHQLRGYVLEPIPIKITLFRTEELAQQGFDPDRDWSTWSEEPVDVRIVPGTHQSIWQEPDVAHLGAALNDALSHVYNRINQNTPRDL